MENLDNPQAPTNTDINKLLNIAQKWNKYRETVYRNVKKYKQNHKSDPNFIEYNRRNSKNYYNNHKQEILDKRHIKKWQSNIEIYTLMNISY
jgi:hypothetical protein